MSHERALEELHKMSASWHPDVFEGFMSSIGTGLAAD
jgi:hypothetical protein